MTAQRRQFVFQFLVCLIAAALSSCSTLQVSPVLPQIPQTGQRTISGGGISLTAKWLEKPEEYAPTFKEDLGKAGLAAVWASLENSGTAACGLDNVDWELVINGKARKRLTTRQVLKHYYKAKRIRIYSLHKDSLAAQGLETISLKSQVLEPGHKASGLLFFRGPSPSGKAKTAPMVLRLKSMPPCGQSRRDIKLVLQNANPGS
jgi:hypothetical protein